MPSNARVVFGSISAVAVLMILLLGFHLGGAGVLRFGIFSPLLGALIGGSMILLCVDLSRRRGNNGEPWLTNERLSWTLIGCGCIAWAIGEAFWRYYETLGQPPFPSLADFGYASFPPLVFTGLILLPSSKRGQLRREFYLLDSLIAMGALLSIAWFLLLGSLAQTPAQSVLAKVLGLYYPTADVALVSCTVFLLLRGAGDSQHIAARRTSLLIAVLGLCIFAGSDFLFNLENNLGTYVEGTWSDLGWPLGMMALGLAAYLRAFMPATLSEALEQGGQQRFRELRFGPAKTLPYLLLIVLFFVLAFNVLSRDSTQESIRAVLVVATMLVVGLVLARQVLTMRDNAQLVDKQLATLQELAQINQNIKERNTALEEGVMYLKDIQTRLANGDTRARATTIKKGELWPLATGLNLMADRMMHSERIQSDAQKVAKAVGDFCIALERARSVGHFVLPDSCRQVPAILRLLEVLKATPPAGASAASSSPSNMGSATPPVYPRPTTSNYPPARPTGPRRQPDPHRNIT